MRGVFGLLLIGGGILLLIGLVSGRITFPLGTPAIPSSAPPGGQQHG